MDRPAKWKSPAPVVGHEVKLVNFSRPGEPLNNAAFEQAFVEGKDGSNRPTQVRFGPDGCAYVTDYGVVQDFGQSDRMPSSSPPATGRSSRLPRPA